MNLSCSKKSSGLIRRCRESRARTVHRGNCASISVDCELDSFNRIFRPEVPKCLCTADRFSVQPRDALRTPSRIIILESCTSPGRTSASEGRPVRCPQLGLRGAWPEGKGYVLPNSMRSSLAGSGGREQVLRVFPDLPLRTGGSIRSGARTDQRNLSSVERRKPACPHSGMRGSPPRQRIRITLSIAEGRI